MTCQHHGEMALLSVPLFIATDLILCRRAITHGLLCLDMLTLAYVLVRVHVDCILCNTSIQLFCIYGHFILSFYILKVS